MLYNYHLGQSGQSKFQAKFIIFTGQNSEQLAGGNTSKLGVFSRISQIICHGEFLTD